MSLFRKPRKAIQRRVFSEQDDEEPMDIDEPQTTSMNVKPSRDARACEKAAIKINTSSTKQSLLSFETEEEGDVFQVKKSSHSKKVMRMYEKERRRREPKDSRVKEEEYKDKKPYQQEIITDDLIVLVNNTPLVPPPAPSLLSAGVIISGKDALYVGKDDLSSEEEAENPEDAHINHRFSRPNNVKKVLESGAIPDAAMIHAARKRRQRAREQGEFIPVEDDEVEEKVKDTGRLVREDEHDLDVDNESDDDEQRIDMGANPAQRDQERRREQFYEATALSTGSSHRLHDQDEDEDDVLHRWEDQQIRKGVTGASATASGLTQDMLLAAAAANAFEMNASLPRVPYAFPSASPSIASSVNDADLNAPCTPSDILERLRQDHSQAIAARDQHKKRLEQVHSDLLQAAEELETLKLDGPRAAQRFRFYQELRGYVTDLVECLDEKVSHIADLEQRAMEMMAKKSEWLIERRRQDVRDQADELASAGKGMLGSAARRIGGAPNSEDEDKLRRAVEREGRRTRRRKAREMAAAAAAAGTIPVNVQVMPRHVQGMSSDDEMPPQQCTELETEQQDMHALVQNVFEDVMDDYSTVANILIKFEEWRETDVNAYNDAYATLCIPKIVSPLIRLQLVFWDPLSESSDDLEKLQWYRTLALYGLHDTETESTLSEDPDVGLLPTVVEKLIVPRITEFVERCWDPVSTSQTLRLVGIVTRCVRRFPSLGPDSRCLTNLFKAILARIHTALENDVFIPIVPKLTDAPRSPFFQRQFAGGLKLLRNITCWQGLLNDVTLKELAINKLLNRYLLNGIKVCQLTDAVAKLGLISHILPRVWLQMDGEHLKMFNNCVTNLAQQLDKNNPVHLESIDTLTSIIKCKRM